MPEQKIGFDQWSDDVLDEVGVSRDRATEVHKVLASWEKRQLTAKLAYRMLANLYWLRQSEDNDETRFYQNDMMQRMAFNGGLDEAQTTAMHAGIIALQHQKRQS